MKTYDEKFFDWINATALRSARVMVPFVSSLGQFDSVLDVGCGEGAWLQVWSEIGATDYIGIDGDYVCRPRLLIPADRFQPRDLSGSWSLDRRFDLVQSLEVAEHLPATSAEGFIATLCRHGDVVLFSAAQPGQGGHEHLNEQPPSYWAGLFADHGYHAYDCVRPALAENKSLSPWYRYNTLLFANDEGDFRLQDGVRSQAVTDVRLLDTKGDLVWEARKKALSVLPEPVVTNLSRARYLAALWSHRVGGGQ